MRCCSTATRGAAAGRQENLGEHHGTSRARRSRSACAKRSPPPVRVTGSIEEAVTGADVVVEATRLPAPEPILRTEWIAPGALVVPYGTMSAVELSLTDIMDKVYVDDWGQCRRGRFGALRAHVEQGLVTRQSIAGELADVVAGTRPGRERDDERIRFWHRGLATSGIALGQAILDRAIAQGAGTLLPHR